MKKNLLLLFLSFAIPYVLVETAFRINGKYMSYNERTESGSYVSPFDTGDDGWIFTYKPFAKIEDIKSEFATSWIANNEGLHDKNIPINKTGRRILVLGDSFTEGAGAPNDSCYPRILENLLRANCDSAMEVINCGNSSSDIFFEYYLLKLKMLKYQPDFVLVTINSSDYYDFIIRGGFKRFADNNQLKYRSAPWFEPLYAHSYLVRRMVHDVYGYDYGFLQPDERTLVLGQAEKEMAAVIDSFQYLCNAYKIKLGFIFHPIQAEIMFPESYQRDKLMKHCKDSEIAFADELPFLNRHGIDRSNCQKISWPVDGHFNSKGYELLAQCAYEFIKKQNW